MKIIQQPHLFEAEVRFGILPIVNSSIVATWTSVDVANLEVIRFSNVGTVLVTSLTGGAQGQYLRLIGDGFTQIEHNASIKVNTGATKTLGADKVYRFTNWDGIWYEDA